MGDLPSSQRGMALIFALASVLVISMLLSGALLLSVSHLSLADTDSDYASALYLAEAGVNWELQKISLNAASADMTLSVPQSLGTGTFRAQVLPYPGSTFSTDLFCVQSTGSVHGVSRTVRVQAVGYEMFKYYALFGINSIDLGGNFTVNGAAGTDGVVTINGHPNVNGNFWYLGPNAGGDAVTVSTGYQVYHAPYLPLSFPTVNQAATIRAQEVWEATGAQTVDFFRTHNNNARVYDPVSGARATITNYALDKTAFPTSGSGSNKVQATTLVFPPGDYYFESVDLAAGYTLRIDDSGGPVNIWLGPDAGSGTGSGQNSIDSLNGNVTFASTDPNQFNLYEGSQRELQISGDMTFYGNILAYNGPDASGAYYGSVQLTGNLTDYGSVIAYDVLKGTGSAQITFVSEGGSGTVSGAPILFAFASGWQELDGV